MVHTYLPHPATMPSKFMVSVSLDKVTIEMWEALPAGERSKRIREALRESVTIYGQDVVIANLRESERLLRHRIKKLNLKVSNFEAFGVVE